MTAINSALIATVSTQTLDGFDVATVSLTLANTEYTYNFPAGTKGFQLQNRTGALVKVRKTSGGAYWSLYPGQPWFPTNIKGSSSVSVILESPTAAQTIEVLYWS
jgi:hypothetical protein